jgi:hypothetical protein
MTVGPCIHLPRPGIRIPVVRTSYSSTLWMVIRRYPEGDRRETLRRA